MNDLKAGPPGAGALFLYRLLLKLLPGSLRAEAGEELLQVFSDEYAEVHARSGRMGVAWLWLRTVHDLAWASAAELFTSATTGRSR